MSERTQLEQLEYLVEQQSTRLAKMERILKEQRGTRERIDEPGSRPVRLYRQRPRLTWVSESWVEAFDRMRAPQEHARGMLGL
jgi:hypothetical protein